jgi:probable blue pigment (indigoidine) exporter
MNISKRILPILLLITSTFLMGSSFVVGKLGLVYFSPLILTACRFILGGVLLLAIVLWKMRRMPTFSLLWRSAIIGAFQTAGVMACIFISLKYISAGESSILTFTNPLLVLLFSSILFKEKYSLKQWLGVIIGLAGVITVLYGDMEINRGTWIGLGSSVFWACATLLVKKWGSEFNVWLLTALQMTFGGIILLILALLTENIVSSWNIESIGILLWLAIPGSIVQFSLWFLLLTKLDPSKASSFLFLAPVFGVLTGVWWLNEHLDSLIIYGGLCVFAGIFLTNYKSRSEG